MACDLATLFDLITAAGAAATGYAAWVAAGQLRESREQARTLFEDSLAREYRDLIQAIPTRALLGERLVGKPFERAFDELYRYVDLSNEQAFLRQKKRVSKATWQNWSTGMASNFALPTFEDAWCKISDRAPGSFAELRRLHAEGFDTDPATWD